MVRWAVVGSVLLGAGVCVQAMSLRELRSLDRSSKQGANYVRYYLVGAMEGALEAQAHAVRAGAKPTICLNRRRLEPHMAQALFDTELKRNADLYEADMQVTLVMFNALTTVYTC
ncbi:MAG: hypothetical protein K9K38_03310 [Rhodoferax sp.]|nr:hypothetical protein [Rhodoferax sp.]